MNFCPACGSPNLDKEASCRVCGRSLQQEPSAQPVAATQAGADAEGSIVSSPFAGGTAHERPMTSSGWSSRPDAPATPDRATSDAPPRRPSTGAATPSGFESAPPAATVAAARSDNAMPSFMRAEGRSATTPVANETTSLISEHDLPDWIRQIAVDDAKKLAAERQEQIAAAGTAMPAHLGRPSVLGETMPTGPAPSSWLNRRDTVANAASSAWDATGTPAPARPADRAREVDVLPEQASVAGTWEASVPTAEPPIAPEALPSRGDTRPAKLRRRGSTRDVTASTPVATNERAPGALRAGGTRRVYLLAAVALVAVLFLVAMLVL